HMCVATFERVEYLNSTFKGCNAHMIEVEDKKCIKLNCPNCSQEFEINITSDKELEELKPVLCYLCNKYSRN
ncbi:MAG: hypothetical protein WC939_00415, partial [Acholeplasmataceae bacterium]